MSEKDRRLVKKRYEFIKRAFGEFEDISKELELTEEEEKLIGLTKDEGNLVRRTNDQAIKSLIRKRQN